MKQKMAFISLALIGFVLVFSGSAWASRDHRPGHYVDQRHMHHGRDFRKAPVWRHGPRHRGDRWHRGPWHRSDCPRPAHRMVEKHVYHHYDSDAYDNGGDQYEAAGSVSDPFFSFSFGISGTR